MLFYFIFVGIEPVLVALVNETDILYVNNESTDSVWPGNCCCCNTFAN